MPRVAQCIVASLLILISAFIFKNQKQMSPVWTVPFLSGAANYTLGAEWYYSPAEVDKYALLSDDEKEEYKFKPNPPEELIKYGHNPIGYMLVIVLAKKIFFWVGDIPAIKYFQILVHLLSSLLIFLLYKPIERWIFLFLYSCNPLIIYFVTFPFAYFWLTIPSVIFLYLHLKNYKVSIVACLVTGLGIAIALTIRPTFLSVLPLLFGLLFYKGRNLPAFTLSLAMLLATFFFINKPYDNKTIWHTVYIGVGAYPNPYQITMLSDNTAYELYARETGEKLNVRPGGNFYTREVFQAYSAMLKKNYLVILSSSPLLIFWNATLNFFQSFSLGYFVDYPLWVSYLSSFVGFVFVLILLIKRQFIWFLAIALSCLTFTPYFPPIQAYMFGNYILLVAAFIELLNNFGIIKKINNRIQNSKIYPMLPSA